MSRQGGVDRFRLAAALLVVAIHTSPLTSFSGTADFFLTRVIARVAVPFFFLVTGYFVLPRLARHPEALCKTWRKTALLYAGATALYLPLMIYKGDLSRPNVLWQEMRDVVFNGTFYHLWYLPALLLGLPLAAWLLRRLGERRALAAAGVLYLIGVLGDSWYGLTCLIPGGRAVYDLLFFWGDYTRNGLFFTPLFLLLGHALAVRPRLAPRRAAAGLAASLALMTGEAFLLRWLAWPRHDSMYLSLPAVLVFLTAVLTALPLRGGKRWATLSLAVYVIHPWAIVLIRGGAGVAGLTGLLVENSLVHYLAVCALSLVFAAAVVWAQDRLPPRPRPPRRAWAEIDLDALEHNVNALSGKLEPDCRLMAVLKADGYGHGGARLGLALNGMGVDAFAVATAREALELRRAGVRGMILLLGRAEPEEARRLCRRGITLTVVDEDHARALEALGTPLTVHWKVDTGMHRLGVDWRRLGQTAEACPHLRTEGVYSHLCVSDSLEREDRTFTRHQVERFRAAVEGLKARGIQPGSLHLQSSYGLLNYTGLRCAYVRVGIALYGALSQPGEVLSPADLRPVMSLRARIVSIHTLEPEEGAGYGLAFRPGRPARVAAVSLGYADGWPRSLSGRGHALVRGVRVPVAGRVCMDQLLLDVTDVEGAVPGDTATFLGRDGALTLTAEEAAREAGTITNELFSRIGRRVERVYLG